MDFEKGSNDLPRDYERGPTPPERMIELLRADLAELSLPEATTSMDTAKRETAIENLKTRIAEIQEKNPDKPELRPN